MEKDFKKIEPVNRNAIIEPVNRNAIEVGLVKHLRYCGKGGNRTLRKIIFVRAQTIGNIVPVDEPKKGIDLCKKIKEQNIVYPIFDTGYTKDGDIVIDNSIEAGAYLKYLGFPEQLDATDLEQVYNILLKRSTSFYGNSSTLEERNISITSLLGVEDYEKLKNTVNQLMDLKLSKISTNVSMKERVYVKK